jgi:WhiB family transcriptional regulator, redox-sensing transcriptional regulator
MGGKTRGTTGIPNTSKKIEEQGDRKWMRRAKCAGEDTNFFYIEKGESERAAEIRRYCSPCSVREQCLEYALENNIRHGWWGGMGETARGRLKRQRGQEGDEGDAIIEALGIIANKVLELKTPR